MVTYYKYRLWCTNENDYKYVVLTFNDIEPTECPDNSEHVCDTEKTALIERLDADSVN